MGACPIVCQSAGTICSRSELRENVVERVKIITVKQTAQFLEQSDLLGSETSMCGRTMIGVEAIFDSDSTAVSTKNRLKQGKST